MAAKQKLKMTVDLLMTVALLHLMPYELISEAAHEWIGAAMFLLFILHHILNRKWTGHLLKGRYTPFRILQTILVVLILVSMLGSMASGILLSRHIFSFLKIRGLTSLARNLHMICAYWGFVLMSVHLGLHWSMMVGIAGKRAGKPSAKRRWIARTAAMAVAVYGAYAFVKRGIADYMLMRVHFVFFDYEEPVLLFLLDYLAAMGLFVFIGHYVGKALKYTAGKRKNIK